MNNKVLAKKLGWTLFLLWVCYVPEIELDMSHVYTKAGTLKLGGSRTGSYHLFKGKVVCETMVWFGCNSGLYRNSELEKIDDGKTPVELVFVPNRGNAIWKDDMLIEVRAHDAVVPGYSKAEMIKRMQSLQNQYLGSIIIFIFFFPVILFPKILKVFARKD